MVIERGMMISVSQSLARLDERFRSKVSLQTLR